MNFRLLMFLVFGLPIIIAAAIIAIAVCICFACRCCCFSGRRRNVPAYSSPTNVLYQAHPNYQNRAQPAMVQDPQYFPTHSDKTVSPAPPYSPPSTFAGASDKTI